MNARLAKILEFLGLWKPVNTKKELSPLEKLQAELGRAGDDTGKKNIIIQTARQQGEESFRDLLQKRDVAFQYGISEAGAHELLEEILRQVDLLAFITGPEQIDLQDTAAFEQVLREMVTAIRLISIPGEQASRDLENYLTRTEEIILLDEAKGKYQFHISENARWVRLPLLTTLDMLPGRKRQAGKTLAKIFTVISQMRLLEFGKRVPMHPISFIELTNLCKDKSVSRVRAGENGEWYWCVFSSSPS